MFAYVHIEKCGGTTYESILRQSFGVRHFNLIRNGNSPFTSPNEFKKINKLFPFVKSVAGHTIYSYTGLNYTKPDIKFYTIVREPVSRLISHYQYHVIALGINKDFESWISQDKFHNFMTKKISGEANTQKAIDVIENDFLLVGDLKQFDVTLLLLKQHIKELDIRYIPKNVSVSSKIKEKILSNELYKQMIEEFTEIDSKIYRYVVDTYFPKQIENYKGDLDQDLSHLHQTNVNYSGNTTKLITNRLFRNLVYKPVNKIFIR